MTVEEYKTKNLMKVEIKSKDIGNMVPPWPRRSSPKSPVRRSRWMAGMTG